MLSRRITPLSREIFNLQIAAGWKGILGKYCFVCTVFVCFWPLSENVLCRLTFDFYLLYLLLFSNPVCISVPTWLSHCSYFAVLICFSKLTIQFVNKDKLYVILKNKIYKLIWRIVKIFHQTNFIFYSSTTLLIIIIFRFDRCKFYQHLLLEFVLMLFFLW